MAKTKKATALTTQEQIIEAQKELMILNQQKAEIESQIKDKKQVLAALDKKLENERLNEIAAIANSAGISVMDILQAFQDGDILSLIPTEKSAAVKEAPKNEFPNTVNKSEPLAAEKLNLLSP